MYNPILIYHHLGIGDHFLCNGLVHCYLTQYSPVYLVCKKQHLITVQSLYSAHSDVRLLPIDTDKDIVDFLTTYKMQFLRVGFENVDPIDFVDSFYRQVGLTKEYSYSYFNLPDNLKGSDLFYDKVVEQYGNEYTFVHKISSVKEYELNIPEYSNIFYASHKDSPNVLDYVKTICNAKEIHFINSGLYPLIERLKYLNMIKTDKIYYHNIRKFSEGGIPIHLSNDINTINYN